MEFLFTSNRLLFREFTLEDAPLIFDLNSDPLVTKYLHEPLTTLQKAKEVLAEIILPQYHLYNHGRWAVHLSEDYTFIGWCGLKFRADKNEVDLGYRFIKKYWGLGYATEAGKRCLGYGYQHLKLKKITAATHIENLASQKVLTKLGFVLKGEEVVDDAPAFTYVIHP